MTNEEIENTMARLEAEDLTKQYHESGTRDDFDTWKMKKYVDGKFISLYRFIILAVIILIVLHALNIA